MRKIFGDIAYEQASTVYGALNCKFLQAALKREKYGEIRPGVYADFVNLDEIDLDTEYSNHFMQPAEFVANDNHRNPTLQKRINLIIWEDSM